MSANAIISIGKFAFKYRKTIYKILTAQDRVIGSAWRRGGYSKAAQYGARSGALAGTVGGAFITDYAPDSPGNELQKPIQKKQPVYTTRKPYKTRSGRSIRSRSRYPTCDYPRRFQR